MSDNPYQVLGVGVDAGEEEIRQRYLTLVRQFPPDQQPEQFARVRAAYDELRDPVKNLRRRLFSPTATDTIEALAAKEYEKMHQRRVPTDALLLLADD